MIWGSESRANLPAGITWKSRDAHPILSSPRTGMVTIRWTRESIGGSISPRELDRKTVAIKVGSILEQNVNQGLLSRMVMCKDLRFAVTWISRISSNVSRKRAYQAPCL